MKSEAEYGTNSTHPILTNNNIMYYVIWHLWEENILNVKSEAEHGTNSTHLIFSNNPDFDTYTV